MEIKKNFLKSKRKLESMKNQEVPKTMNFSYENAIELDFKSENTKAYKKNVNQNLRKALDYLFFLKEPSLLLDDQQAYEAIFYIAKKVTRSLKAIDLNQIFDQSNGSELFSNILTHLYNINSEYDFSLNEIASENASKTTTFNERCITIFGCMNYILYLIINQTFTFAVNFQMTNGLKAFIMFLKDVGFVNKNLNKSFNPLGVGEVGIIDEMTLNINALSHNCEENKSLWSDLDVVNILLRISKMKPKTSLDCYLTIANIVDDNQCDELEDLKQILNVIIENVKRCAEDFELKKFHRKDTKIFTNNKFRIIKAHVFVDKYLVKRSLYFILNALYKLSINEKVKELIYFDEVFYFNFNKIINNANQPELFYALNLIGQLSFSEKICISIRENKEFIKFLNETVSKIKNYNIKRIYQQIKWNLFDKSDRIEKFKKSSDQPVNTKQIMISFYVSDQVSKDFSIKIKQKIESLGNYVWLNHNGENAYDHIRSIEAIENSYCYIMIVNEKFRQSISNQIEARYAFEINKPIISLIIQNGFESASRHGWLGIILRCAYSIYFNKYNFNECMRLFEIKVNSAAIGNLTNGKFGNEEVESKEIVVVKKEPEKFTEIEVTSWLQRNNIDPLIIEFLQTLTCDGLILQQIYFMKINDPQFYNYSFKKINSLNFLSLVKFSAELDKLFSSTDNLAERTELCVCKNK